MKKITLLFLIFFAGSVATVFAMRYISGSQAFPLNNSNGNATSTPGSLTTAEVAQHSTENDCYLIVNNKVYNVSGYINSHPGGRKAMLNQCGKEASRLFASIHSNSAWDLLNNYYVADLNANGQPPTIASPRGNGGGEDGDGEDRDDDD